MRKDVLKHRSQNRRLLKLAFYTFLFLAICVAAAGWLGAKVTSASDNLGAANRLASQLRNDVLRNDPGAASETVAQMQTLTTKARESSEDAVWSLATVLPWFGPNLTAAREATTTADDIVRLGATPLVEVFQALNWDTLVPKEDGVNLAPLTEARPKIVTAAQAVGDSSERLDAIQTDQLLPQVAEPLVSAKAQLAELHHGLKAAADVATLAPAMMGSDSPRQYLLMVQNNAELRSTGGIPGALALLSVDKGRLALAQHSSAAELGTFDPAIDVDPEQRNIYSGRLGKFMQDVNLTPDFPTSARTAQEMWERKYGMHVDGVISIDPVVLSYLLSATGPVNISEQAAANYERAGLPSQLSKDNVVKTLLSDVYSKITEPKEQDVYFAGVAQVVFDTLSNTSTDAEGLLNGISRGEEEGRVKIWSNHVAEQEILSRYPVSGAVSGPSVLPAQFGVFFNDGTGAKMDYYVQRTVQLTKECPRDGYEETTVRITSTNTAPPDAATSLPRYVTGGGAFGIPPGEVQTNIVVYGPAQAHVETARSDGEQTNFAPYAHGNRPVGVLAVRLAPGESTTTEFTFGKIVQHVEPDLVVTPTVQDVKDVVLPTRTGVCA